jgi:hypothetical protein
MEEGQSKLTRDRQTDRDGGIGAASERNKNGQKTNKQQEKENQHT